jgi:hypothetical protein
MFVLELNDGSKLCWVFIEVGGVILMGPNFDNGPLFCRLQPTVDFGFNSNQIWRAILWCF